MKITELYEYIDRCVLNKFKFIQEFGYNHFIDYTKKYPNYNPDFRIVFENHAIDRIFEVSYFYKGEADNEIINNFSFTFWNEKGMDIINLKNYMLFIQKQEVYFYLDIFEGTFEEKLDQLLDYVVNVLQTYLMPVLKGEEWIDVPTNWYGAK